MSLRNYDDDRFVLSGCGKVLVEALAELPHLHADDVVFRRAVIRASAENAPPDVLLAQFLWAIRKRAVADVEQQFA
jgi:hypothetical protein